MGHPGGQRISGSAEDDLNASLAHSADHAIHPGVVELSVFGLPQAPRGLAHADHAETGRLHQRDVLVEAGNLISGHVLVVVGGTVEHGGEVERLSDLGRRDTWAGLLRGGCGGYQNRCCQ